MVTPAVLFFFLGCSIFLWLRKGGVTAVWRLMPIELVLAGATVLVIASTFVAPAGASRAIGIIGGVLGATFLTVMLVRLVIRLRNVARTGRL
jgi:hypothetical protein